MSQDNVADAARDAYAGISNFANGYHHYSDMIAEELLHDHKLLQEYVIFLFLHCIRRMAQSDERGNRTLQNERAIDICKRVVEEVLDR